MTAKTLAATASTGIDAQSPAFKTARETCSRLTPAGSGAPQTTESQFLAALRFAKCMRTHGLPEFPDPRALIPPAPILVVGPGLFFHSPNFDPNTPAVNQTEAACEER
jgi:hypothetical protein